jgi:hypothetical protein
MDLPAVTFTKGQASSLITPLNFLAAKLKLALFNELQLTSLR